MNELILNIKGKAIRLVFGSWVQGQLIQRGWKLGIHDVLQKIYENPSDSMALLIHLALCNAEKKSLSLNEINADDAYDIIDALSIQELESVKDTFLVSAYGDGILKAIADAIKASDESEDDQTNQKKTISKKLRTKKSIGNETT